jgi:hypothetical protein
MQLEPAEPRHAHVGDQAEGTVHKPGGQERLRTGEDRGTETGRFEQILRGVANRLVVDYDRNQRLLRHLRSRHDRHQPRPIAGRRPLPLRRARRHAGVGRITAVVADYDFGLARRGAGCAERARSSRAKMRHRACSSAPSPAIAPLHERRAEPVEKPITVPLRQRYLPLEGRIGCGLNQSRRRLTRTAMSRLRGGSVLLLGERAR